MGHDDQLNDYCLWVPSLGGGGHGTSGEGGGARARVRDALGGIHHERKEYELAVEWYTMGAEAGLPKARFNLGLMLDLGEGVAAPDYPAAADWYYAAVAGNASAANNLSQMYNVGRGRAWQIMPGIHMWYFVP